MDNKSLEKVAVIVGILAGAMAIIYYAHEIYYKYYYNRV